MENKSWNDGWWTNDDWWWYWWWSPLLRIRVFHVATKQSASSYTAVFEWKVSQTTDFGGSNVLHTRYILPSKRGYTIPTTNAPEPESSMDPTKNLWFSFFLPTFFSARRKTAVAWRLRVVIPRMAAKVGSNGKLGSRGADKDEWRESPIFHV